MSKKKTLNIALIGTKFMGRAHSNAWLKVSRFFDLPCNIILHTVCGRDEHDTTAFADKWGWENCSTDWKKIIADPQIDIVDICTPNDMHAKISIAVAKTDKHIACEKPLAGTIKDAKAMLEAVKMNRKPGKYRTSVWFNYRRCPAVALAHQLVSSGRLGKIYHVRAAYLQEWGGPDTPLVWRFNGKVAGSGAHGDLNAHIIDMARFITGDEITEVSGAIEHTFIKQRILLERTCNAKTEIKGNISSKNNAKFVRTGKSTVDDAVLFLARFKRGAIATFESTRLATGNKNRNTIEINGDKGAVKFNFERMNELEYYDATAEAAVRGWTNIMCTHASAHPYASAWWPDAHVLGYEHGFINQAADIVNAVANKVKPVVPLPDFADAYRTQCVLEAAIISARQRRPVRISEIMRKVTVS